VNGIELMKKISIGRPRTWWMDQGRIDSDRSNELINVGEQTMM
jgi:hypothetical protein